MSRFKIESCISKDKFDKDNVGMCGFLDLTVKLNQDAQHDGRPWGNDCCFQRTNDIVDEIMSEIKVKVVEFVFKVDPLGGHR